MAYSEVVNVSGFVGNFKVTVKKKTRYVNEKECTACGECVKVCPITKPDAYQTGFSTRKAIYIPFPQAVPASYLINMDDCLGINPIACGKCADVCEKKCIDFDQQDKFIDIEVGAIIVATGMDVYDPSEIDEYGYTRFPNVITSMEFERLICAGGPTEGHFIRPSDRQRPKRIGFIQCVGSRSAKRGNPYCSNICCMNTVKDCLLLKDHYPDTDCTVFYMDIRAFGKSFEDFYMRSKEEGVKYLRGLPGEIEEDPATRNLRVVVENTNGGGVDFHEFDMIVLSTGVIPQKDSAVIRKLLTLSKTSDGFLMEAHPRLKPVDAPTRGVFLAGCAESPKDIKDSVAQAGAAASHANILLNAGHISIEAVTSVIDDSMCNGCELCIDVCPYHAIQSNGKKSPPTIITAACAGCGNCGAACPTGSITMRHFTDMQIEAQIDAILEEDGDQKVLGFACNWCSYAGGDFAGISRLQYPTDARLIRTMCSARVDEEFIWRGFHKGAAMVLVSGCHYADCHYISANRQTVQRVNRVWDKMERLGIRPERLQLEWISAAEGQKFAKVMRDIEQMRKRVTKEEIDETVRILNEERDKAAAKKAAKTDKKEQAAA